MNFMKKELYRVFTDKKLIFSLFIMPFILFFGIFALIGYLQNNMKNDINKHIGSVYIQNAPNEFKTFCSSIDLEGFDINYIDSTQDTGGIKQNIKQGNIDLLIVFDNDFMDSIKNYANETTPQIKTYYNESENYSQIARSSYIDTVINPFQNKLISERFGNLNDAIAFGIDIDNKEANLQDDNKAFGKILGTMFPYLITILLFVSVMSITVESVAGEKERGTIAAFLITPVSREKIVIGKILGLTIISLLSALVYGISTVIGMQFMMNGIEDTNIGLNINYSIIQIAQIIIIILIMSISFVAIVSLISSLCKNAKEANTYVMPIYLLVVASGLFTMFGNEKPSLVQYFIPIYNCPLALKSIFAMELTMIEFLITLIVSIVFTLILLFAITKVFNNEKIMFNS